MVSNTDFLFLLSEFFYPLLGRAKFRGRCWAAIWLSHRSEPSGRAVSGEVDGLDIGGRHGWSMVCSSAPHCQAAEQSKTEYEDVTV